MSGSTRDNAQVRPAQEWTSRRFEGSRTLDLFVAAQPASDRDDERTQFLSMAARALDGLAAHGLMASDIACGWIYLARSPSWDWRQLLGEAFGAAGLLPITALVQPPAAPRQFCSMQLHAIRSTRQSGVWHGGAAGPAAATVLRSGARHLRLMGVTPRPEMTETAPVVDLAYDMLAQAGHALRARGLCFADVVRTWIYVQGIAYHYELLNQARNRYFAEQRLTRLPASTCVEGSLVGASVPVAMDLYAIGPSDDVSVAALAPGAMGEAPAYGSAFARGSHIREPERSTVYVSGTASIDERGAVVAACDIDGQLARMFGNVRALLSPVGLDLSATLTATVYLKRPELRHAYAKAAAAAGLPADAPVTVVLADICRPEWLCEIELCAACVSPR